MSDVTQPIFQRLEDLPALRNEIQALDLSIEPMFIGTADHLPDIVLRLFKGGIFPGTGSLPDSVAKLDEALARRAKRLSGT